MKNDSTVVVFKISIKPFFPACIQGGLRGDDPETTLTAFVLIALAEAKQAGIRCTGQDGNDQMEVIYTKEKKYYKYD